MISKLTSKNQITLPKSVLNGLNAQYFEVEKRDGEIILKPVFINAADEVRDKLNSMGISEDDISEAVKWARKPVCDTTR